MDYTVCGFVFLCLQSLEPLVETISASAGETTTVLCCYEQRSTGNKPELERKFFEVSFACKTAIPTIIESLKKFFREVK